MDRSIIAKIARIARNARVRMSLTEGPSTYGTTWKVSRIVAVFLLCVCRSVAADISVSVPLDHWSYSYIERFEAKGVLTGLGDGIKPFSRTEMAGAISDIMLASDGLSEVELAELDLLRKEFQEELDESDDGTGTLRSRLASRQPPGVYRSEEGVVKADLLARQQTDLLTGRGRGETETVFRQRVGGQLRGQLAERVGFNVSFEQTREQGSRSYDFRHNVFEQRLEIPQLKGDLADYHQAKAYFLVAVPALVIEVGKSEVSWGPAPLDNLGLGNNAPTFDMIRLRARLGAFKLASISGVLRPCPDRGDSPLCHGLADLTNSYIIDGVDRRLDREKYLAAHRLEVAIAPWLDLGFQEAVVYGDRSPQLTYLNPLMFYHAAQSYQGDEDNLMLGFDIDFHPGNGVRYYLAYVADDMKKLRIFSEDFVNKFALQTGMFWVDPLGFRDSDLRFEYVRIEPWVFTHKIPVNTFRHFDAPLGHSLGPNSDRITLKVNHRPSRDLAFGLGIHRKRHGDNELLPDGSERNVGGDLHQGRRPGDQSDNKKLLDGVVGKWTGVSIEASWRVWGNFEVAGSYGLESGDNVPLPPNQGADVPLDHRTGYGDGREQSVSLDFRYGYF